MKNSCQEPAEQHSSRFRWNVPNTFCIARIVGSLGLPVLALLEQPVATVILYACLGISDLLDGPIARWTGQTSSLGARLDSLADYVLSICLVVSVSLLKWEMIRGELAWLATAFGSYLVAAGACYLKFGQFPSYHTISAKITHFLVAIAGIVLLVDGPAWPLRVAAAGAILTNLESLVITWRLRDLKPDVPSIFTLPPTASRNANARESEGDQANESAKG